MTETKKRRLLPTGHCFCGCGQEVGIDRWFVFGHDITAADALRAVQGGLSLPQLLAEAGFGPERSVVQEAVDQAGWLRCEGCTYAGTPAGLAAHTRISSCAARKSPASAETSPGAGSGEEDGVVTPEPVAAESTRPATGQGAPPREAGSTAARSVPRVRVEAGVARGQLLPGEDDPSWNEVPLHLRQALRGPAHQLVTPVRGLLRAKEQRPVLSALRAAQRMRMTGRHWLLLMNTERGIFGSQGNSTADALFRVLGQVLAEHQPLAQDQQDVSAAPEEITVG
ncbi:hypothetical protein [Streptomyces lavenduligriseus]|uniref:Uncharacterized protein n=1 Tax=Streptomyces lavenduligriseus TaxID=67315 RepID=A0ABT0P8F9_9ACTN|nr:hypothetical protein [Streptomyces lavenduligriseus]MCL3999178.1 hypothetical protein [Streptomyces lavenduligriseus]